MITLDNYEEYLVMHADGELQPHEEEALQVFLNDHPHLKEELAVYEQARLVPDESIVYAQKEALLKPVPAKRIAFMPGWRTLSIAAGIAALLVLSIVALNDGFNTHSTTTPVIANVDSNNKLQQIAPSPVTTSDTQAQQNVAATTNNNEPVDGSNTNTVQQVPVNTNAVVVKHDSRATKRNKGVDVDYAREIPKPITEVVDLSRFAATPVKEFPVVNASATVAGNVGIDGFSFAANSPEEKKNWIDKLPIEDEKKDQLNALASAVAYGYDKATDFKNSLNEKKLTVRVEKRKLILSF